MANESLAKADWNPHCKPMWPMGAFQNHDAEKLWSASYASTTLVNLLIADEQIRDDLESSDPEEKASLPKPYTENIRWGMLHALQQCVGEVAYRVERLSAESRHGG